jgi:hypothetical protein
MLDVDSGLEFSLVLRFKRLAQKVKLETDWQISPKFQKY